MRRIKPHWRRWLLLFTALATLASLVAGCAGEEGAVEETPKVKETIKFYDGSWESLWISNAVAQYIIKEGYGYPVETVVLDTAVMQVSLSQGDIHVNMEQWPQNIIEWYNEQIALGNIIELAECLEGGPQFFMIPQWVHDQYGIDSILDMPEHWELFKDPEDPSKGRFINCRLGWQCGLVNRLKLETYGLLDTYNIMEPGSAGAMDAAYIGAAKKNEPIFGYYWAPTALMGMYDWYILEEPEYTEEVWDKLQTALADEDLPAPDEACAYPSIPLPITVHKSMMDIAPEVVEMLEDMVIGLDAMNKLAAWSQDNEVSDYFETAIYYLRNYDSTWKTWVPTDIYNKVKTALAGED